MTFHFSLHFPVRTSNTSFGREKRNLTLQLIKLGLSRLWSISKQRSKWSKVYLQPGICGNVREFLITSHRKSLQNAAEKLTTDANISKVFAECKRKGYRERNAKQHLKYRL